MESLNLKMFYKISKKLYFLAFLMISFISVVNSQVNSDSFKIDSLKPIKINLKHIEDHIHLYTDSQALVLDNLISEFANSDSIEIKILTTDAEVSTEGFDALTLDSARKQKIGAEFHQKGIMIGISPKLRYMRIQNTNPIMRILSNFETKYIVDNEFTPYFKSGDYYNGTFNGLMSLTNTLRINNKPKRNSR